MNKKITIIELLNNIAKGKIEIGTKFNWHYRFNDVKLIYMKKCGAIGLYFEDGINDFTGETRYIGLFERYNYQILNDKVEILEENKPIIEKINLDRVPLKGKEVPRAIDYLLEGRINEIIDYINKKENK